MKKFKLGSITQYKSKYFRLTISKRIFILEIPGMRLRLSIRRNYVGQSYTPEEFREKFGK